MFWKKKIDETSQPNEFDNQLEILRSRMWHNRNILETNIENVFIKHEVSKLFDGGSLAMMSSEILFDAREKMYNSIVDFIEAQTAYNNFLNENRENLCVRQNYQENTATYFSIAEYVYKYRILRR
jgi:hypothetical protein